MKTASCPEWETYGEKIRGEMIEPGGRVGRFVIVEAVSMTLFGIFYAVEDRHSGEPFSLHIFPRGLSRDRALREAVSRDVVRVKGILDPAILKPREILESEGVLGIVFEGLPGARTLTRLFEETSAGKGFPADRVEDFILKAGRALQAASGANIHHLTLTPENVLVTPDGEVKLYGFGFREAISRPVFETFVSSVIVPLKRNYDTAGYSSLEVMSPEFRNGEDYDQRADIYTLGLLTYYLLTHLRPVVNWTLPSVAREDVSEGWDFFISRCLEPEPANRYPTFGAFIADLQRVDALGATAEEEVQARERGIWRKLDRIPLPETITTRYAPQTLRLIRLALLGIIGVFSVGAASLCYVLIFEEDLDERPLPIVQAGSGQPANLVLHVEPREALVRVLGADGRRFLVREGKLRLRGSFREYRFAVEAPHHKTARFSVSLDRTEKTHSVMLDLSWGLLRIRGTPGARIDVVNNDGKHVYLDVIPESGEWASGSRLFANVYHLVVRQAGYAPKEFPDLALVENEWTEIEAALEPLPASLRVLSDPSGATVSIEGKEVGTTPLAYEGVESLSTVAVTVAGDGFRPREQTVKIEPGQENVLDFGDLEAMTGSVSLAIHLRGEAPSTEELAGLRIALAGETYNGTAHLNRGLRAGEYQLQADHPDYYPKSATVQVRDRSTTQVTVDLAPRPGKLRIVLPDGPSRIFVGGERADPVDDMVALPPEKEVEVVVVVKDFLPVRRTFYHAPNEIEEWSPELRPLPGPKRGESWEIPYRNLTMVWIAPGEYLMGSPRAEQLRLPNEGPPTRIELSSGFWAGTTEVTQEVFQRVMSANPSTFEGPQRPVDSLTWSEANAFCARLTEAERDAGRLPEGYVYRLPTEAEWEYIARAGTNEAFSFGANATLADGNFLGRYPREYGSAEIISSDHHGTLAVASYAPNPWGLYDVHGNVREWVYDGYNDRLAGGRVVDFVRLAEGRGRAVRGGGWDDSAHRARSAARDQLAPDARRNSVGFRIVLAPALASEQAEP